jgi:RNA recognition motif-containing protein
MSRREALTRPQLQRHPRGALRSLWQIRPGPVRSPFDTPAGNVVLSASPVLMLDSQIRQGIANNTKGTAFVVYEDVMDAKSACDKLNGFNFQNRYLVGRSFRISSSPKWSADSRSIISPARQDGQGLERSRRSPGKLRKAQKTAWYRLA